MTALDDLFEQTEDQPIPGGCDRCNAYQTVSVTAPGIYSNTVHHDDWCPFLLVRKSGTN